MGTAPSATLLIFLSTLSLRRATKRRAPQDETYAISIHALLAESDNPSSRVWARAWIFLSTLSLRRATIRVDGQSYGIEISIHALLAESDGWAATAA